MRTVLFEASQKGSFALENYLTCKLTICYIFKTNMQTRETEL